MTDTVPPVEQSFPVRVRADLDVPLAVAGEVATARAARTGACRVVGLLRAGQRGGARREHYLILAVRFGGGTWFVWTLGDVSWAWGGSLVGVLVLFAGIMLAITGAYPVRCSTSSSASTAGHCGSPPTPR